ncbi:hypothetical protein HMI54_015049 [Coelomomyces lativittatus]|nr:hypothetical protein HMI56_007045 [Coelomomyces lativittatus]KAJ1512424.1 hypothetical protein HMI55_006235 [Coelomomyces lativittatus]KAJ1518565.1 hypothetical protein HMI54_015049 [Coelomomyces lativittatus]
MHHPPSSLLVVKRPTVNILDDEVLGYAQAFFWKNIQNVSELLDQLTSKTPSEHFKNVIILNAEMIYSQAHLMTALQRAFLNFKLNQMKMRTLGTELLYLLSPYPNIKESFQTFGLTSATRHILLLKILSNDDLSDISLSEINPWSIHGDVASIQDIGSVCSIEKLLSTYKLAHRKSSSIDNPACVHSKELELSLIEKIATKGLL